MLSINRVLGDITYEANAVTYRVLIYVIYVKWKAGLLVAIVNGISTSCRSTVSPVNIVVLGVLYSHIMCRSLSYNNTVET